MIKTLEEVKKIEKDYIESIGGFYNLTEFNQKINDIQRELIKAFKKEYGKCYIYNINRNEIVKHYEGEKVYNFGGDFILSENSQELVELIKQNRQKCSMKTIDKIYDYVELKKGICLKWV